LVLSHYGLGLPILISSDEKKECGPLNTVKRALDVLPRIP
jgi:hypothetical protein